ncbi:MAG: Npt1/Npt2 family nucleotide transporter [Halioglobus sp.]
MIDREFTATERVLSLFTTLRAGEGRVCIQLCAQSFLLMFAYYLLKVIREPMILADGSAELKAYTTAAQALLLMLIVPLFTRLYRHLSGLGRKHHLYRRTLIFFTLNLVGFAVAHALGWPIAIIFYIWLGIFSVLVLALFWAFSADLFNVKSGQRIFPLIAAASTLGALFGSGTAGWLDLQLGHSAVMILSAAALCLPVWLSLATEQYVPDGSRATTREEPRTSSNPLLEGFELVWRNGYLTLIAGFVIVFNLINTNGEFILATFVTEQAATLAQSVTGAESAANYITRFYSTYLFFTTSLVFLIQLFLVSRIFASIGINGALFVLPLFMIASYSLIALLPILAVVRFAMITENSVSYSLQSTTRHALFLPLTRAQKYIGKHTIDTFFLRLGDVLSGSFVYLLSTLVGIGIVSFACINAGLSCVLLGLSVAIGRRHRKLSRANNGNSPPRATARLDDLSILAGEHCDYQIDGSTFFDPDPGDALHYYAYTDHHKPLPRWIKFDGLSRSFHIRPPATDSGTLKIRVVAKDFDGLEAELSFTVRYGV